MISYVIYARESSADLNKAPDINSQINYIRQFIKDKTQDITHRFYSQEFIEKLVYEDNGFSGGDWTRPAWNKLVKDSRTKLFKYVFVWSQDRIARDVEQFRWFCRNMAEYNILVYTINDGEIELETLGGRLKHTTMATMDEYYRAITSDKVKRAYAIKKSKSESKGEKINWGRKAYFTNEGKNLLVETIRQIVKDNPNIGTKIIARLLPEQEYVIINKETNEPVKKKVKISKTMVWKVCREHDIQLNTKFDGNSVH
jgi:DNA invertase Pin-like site-specific DNA recombinase